MLASVAQFIWKHKAHSPFTDMWVAISIIVAVYFVLSMLEAIRNFIVISPVNMHLRQSESIALLTTENVGLKEHPFSRQEERQRERMMEILRSFSEGERKVVRYILDHGETGYGNLEGSGIDSRTFSDATRKGVNTNLLVERDTGVRELDPVGQLVRRGARFSIKPSLESLLRYIFEIKDI